MNLFNLNKVTNRIVVIVLVIISLVVVAVTILLAIMLTKINLNKELDELSHRNLELYYKTNYIIKSFQNRLKTITKQKEFDYISYKKRRISKEVFLQNITTNLLIAAPHLELGHGIGFWFEPFAIDSNRYYGFYAVKTGDSAYITTEYNTSDYDYHHHYWYTNVIPKGWDRKLPLIDAYQWSDLYLDSGYSDVKMITLGMPMYDDKKTIVGITTFDLAEKDIIRIFDEYDNNPDLTVIFRKKFSKHNIYSNNEEFCNENKEIIHSIISSKMNSINIYGEFEINNKDYYVFKSGIDNHFIIALIVPTKYLNSILFSQISIIAGFAILVISLIVFGFVYSYRIIIEQSLTNENLKNFYKKLIEYSPNDLLIFDGKGKLIEYNAAFQGILNNYKPESFDIEFFIKNVVASQDIFSLENFNPEIIDNFKFYYEPNQSHYLLNSFVIDVDNNKSFIFILVNISELIKSETEIKNLNKNLEKIIANRTEQLEGAMLSLQDLNKKLSKNMDNLSKVNNELSVSEKKLKSTIDTKDKFFSVITHDIKDPLHSIKMIVELLKNYFNMMKIEEINSYYNKITNTIDSVNSLIENVLLWSKSQSNLILFEPEIFDLNSSIHNSIKLLDSAISQKSIKIRKSDERSLFVKTDKNMFEVIFRNILSNAIKFSKKNSLIDVEIDEVSSDSKLIITIQDYGIGMDETTMQSLFYNQGKNRKSGTEGEKGTGIGLLLCKNFIDLMGEDIWVNSNIDKGSTFSFTVNKSL